MLKSVMDLFGSIGTTDSHDGQTQHMLGTIDAGTPPTRLVSILDLTAGHRWTHTCPFLLRDSRINIWDRADGSMKQRPPSSLQSNEGAVNVPLGLCLSQLPVPLTGRLCVSCALF